LKQEKHPWIIIILCSTVLFLVNSTVFSFWGQINADEGWYLYASKLVYSGLLPYKDFAFTQTPLLPYVYGLPQIFFPQSIYLGRITSIVFSTIAFILSITIAKKFGGKTAATITALLGATFTYGIYYQSIVKTYSLTTFLFMLAFFVLPAKPQHTWKSILAVIFVLLASFTRLSAIFFATPVIVYAFISSNSRDRLIISAACLFVLVYFLSFVLRNTDSALWGLILHHSMQWGDLTIMEQVSQILSFRIPALIIVFLFYIILWGTLTLTSLKQAKNSTKPFWVLLTVTTGLLLFTIPNLISGGFYTEYFVPFVFVSFPITGIVYAKTYPNQGKYLKAFINLALLFAIIFGFIRGGNSFIDTSGGSSPIEETRKVASHVSKNSDPSDQIFVLEALWLAVESNRQVLPNMTMAQFSYYDVETAKAKRLHLVNSQMIFDHIKTKTPKLVILTEIDWDILMSTSRYENIQQALEENYLLIYSQDNFGQHNDHIDIYVQNENK